MTAKTNGSHGQWAVQKKKEKGDWPDICNRYTSINQVRSLFIFKIICGIDSTMCLKHSSPTYGHTFQRCPVGLRSGECGDDWNTVIYLSRSGKRYEFLWDLRRGALSLWKQLSEGSAATLGAGCGFYIMIIWYEVFRSELRNDSPSPPPAWTVGCWWDGSVPIRAGDMFAIC